MAIFDRSIRISSGIVPLRDAWVQVRTAYWYPDDAAMVVVAQPIYNDGVGAVVRVRNVRNNTFEMRVQNPAGAPVSSPIEVCWLALPTGVWSNGETRFEVRRVESNVVDGGGSFVGEPLGYQQAYADPVVVGQVMTANDVRWSAFWAGGAVGTDAPSAANLRVGRHIGGEAVSARASETLGVVVFEAGTSDINGVRIVAGRTPNAVMGIQDNVVHEQPLGLYALTAVASSAGMNGGDGAWPVLFGGNRYEPFDGGQLRFVVDEDTIADPERAHIAEEINYLAFNADKDAARFISQATFGGYFDQFRNPYRDGYARWIEEQRDKPISLVTPYMDELNALQAAEMGSSNGLSAEEQREKRNMYPANISFINQAAPQVLNFTTSWMRNLVHNQDQLRQRVAFSLSQIMVISGNFSALAGVGASVSDFYDTLARNALGSFRTLLQEVSVHPAMAYYLSHLGNQKASDDGTRQPDENYAREVMQLFSIGLWELNEDGTRVIVDGEPVPTYDNEDVTNLARVFTGLWYQDINFGQQSGLRNHQGPARRPLAMNQDRHDIEPKKLFAGKDWELNLDANGEGMAEITAAVDALVDHPNTPPFIARRLIQFLVTSNPSPAYVQRVANAFKNNGRGERGDLHATVRQVLLDYEARAYFEDRPDYGKVLEPMVRITRMIKAFRAGRDMDPDDIYFWRFSGGTGFFGQWPMFSPSVFNFFQPDYQLGGDFRDTELYAPEMQLMNPITAATGPNELRLMMDVDLQRSRPAITPEFDLNLTVEIEAADNPAALVERLNMLLCRGQMSDGTRSVVLGKLEGINDPLTRVRIAVWIVMMSPEGAVLR